MFMNELPNLSNIIHSISVPKQVLETDIDELRESVYLIIDDFISNKNAFAISRGMLPYELLDVFAICEIANFFKLIELGSFGDNSDIFINF